MQWSLKRQECLLVLSCASGVNLNNMVQLQAVFTEAAPCPIDYICSKHRCTSTLARVLAKLLDSRLHTLCQIHAMPAISFRYNVIALLLLLVLPLEGPYLYLPLEGPYLYLPLACAQQV